MGRACPSGFDVRSAYFQADGCPTVGAQVTDGTYSGSMSFDGCAQGSSQVRGFFLVRDRFGSETWLSTNPVRVTIADTVGPGVTWTASPAILPLARPGTYETTNLSGYAYDASTLPTYLGPLARAYFLATARLDAEQRQRRRELFGSLRDGTRPAGAYHWRLASGRALLEIPVTTIPGIKTPFSSKRRRSRGVRLRPAGAC